MTRSCQLTPLTQEHMVLLMLGVISKFANHTMREPLWWAPLILSNCESEVTVEREDQKKKIPPPPF